MLRFVVIICARNEASVIHSTITHILTADYPPDYREVIVLADNCNDNTAELAVHAGATVWQKTTPSHCKGDVLAWGIAKLYARGKFDAIAVFDADNLVTSDWFKAMNTALQNGASVATGRRLASNARANTIAGWYAIYWSVINELSNHLRTKLCLSGKLTGTGFALKANVLAEKGWHTRTLVEDVEFTIQVNLSGLRVTYVPTALYADEQPIACKPMWRQLKRWATGGWQVLIHYTYPWLTTLVHHPSLRLFDIFFMLLVDKALALLFFYMVLDYCLHTTTQQNAITLLVSMASGILFLACVAQMLSPPKRPKLIALITFPIFSLILACSVLMALIHPTRHWHPIPHTGIATS